MSSHNRKKEVKLLKIRQGHDKVMVEKVKQEENYEQSAREIQR